MPEHRCQYITEWELVENEGHPEGKYSLPLITCDKIAHFKDDLGSWWCAEHWDQLQAMSTLKIGTYGTEGQFGIICPDCNCEVYEGECNCE